MREQAIKSMKLYSQVDRIYRDLAAAGVADEGPLDINVLSQFDQYHYFGTDAVDHAIEQLKLGSDSKVMDVGSGLGGPARYIAHRTGCQVTAVELQEDYHTVACDLTNRAGLAGHITHVNRHFADALDRTEGNLVQSALAAALKDNDKETLAGPIMEAMVAGKPWQGALQLTKQDGKIAFEGNLIAEAMEQITQGRTTLVIAHRMSTITHADRIVVMDSGKIVGNGKHDELLKTCPQYQALATGQLATIDD